MLDVNHISTQSDNVKIFYTQGVTAWQTWIKPRRCNFIWMMCIGGAAAGSNGGTLGNGLGGGGGAVVRALFPANVLPDVLYVQPGQGGQTSGESGNRSFVVINPSGSVPQVMNTVCTSGAAAAALATAETVATVANMGLVNLGNFTAIAGLPNNGTYLTSTIICGGGNGGSSSPGSGFASINLGGNLVTPTINGGSIGGGNGDNGVWNWKPMYGFGGAGGGSNASGVGGNGGNGAYGCGGGGGGQGSTAGGSFGKGGDGLVIIATF